MSVLLCVRVSTCATVYDFGCVFVFVCQCVVVCVSSCVIMWGIVC